MNREGVAAERPEWSRPRLVALRFASIYLVLYELPFILKRPLPPGPRPFVERLASLEGIVRWFGAHVLRMRGELPIFLGGGDAPFEWVRLLLLLVMASAGAALWSLLDRTRAPSLRLFEMLRVYVRYGLAFAMLYYGVVKLLPLQFASPPWTSELLEPCGDLTPWRLLWVFMGSSRGYTIFTGIVETAGAVLLLWRRTTLAGALLLSAALTNVVALNFAYDVAVKIRSMHLLAMAVFLAMPDAVRVARTVFRSTAGQASRLPSALQRPLLVQARPWLKAVLVALCVFMTVHFSLASAPSRNPPPLFGVWLVESEHAAPDDTGVAWHHVAVDDWSGADVERLDDTRKAFTLDDDPEAKTLTFTSSKEILAFAYEKPDADHLVLTSKESHSAVIRLRREVKTFRLLSGEVHWVRQGGG